MNTFTTVTTNVLAQPDVHPDRCPLPRPEALDPARRRLLSLGRVAGLDAGPATHDDLRVRLDATRPTAYVRSDSRPDGLGGSARRAPFARHRHDVPRCQARRRGTGGAALIVRLALDGQLRLRVDRT